MTGHGLTVNEQGVQGTVDVVYVTLLPLSVHRHLVTVNRHGLTGSALAGKALCVWGPSEKRALCRAFGYRLTTTIVVLPFSGAPMPMAPFQSAGTWGSLQSKRASASRGERLMQPALVGSPKRSCQ